MQVKCINKKLLIKAVKKETTGGIIAPTDIECYEVVAKGDEVTKINVGDKVFYQTGARVNVMGEEYVSLSEDDIICIL